MSDVGTKQSVNGFKVLNYSVKKVKEGEKIKLVLEAEVSEVTSGEFDLGSVQKSLWSHMAGSMEVGLSLFMSKKKEE